MYTTEEFDTAAKEYSKMFHKFMHELSTTGDSSHATEYEYEKARSRLNTISNWFEAETMRNQKPLESSITPTRLESYLYTSRCL